MEITTEDIMTVTAATGRADLVNTYSTQIRVALTGAEYAAAQLEAALVKANDERRAGAQGITEWDVAVVTAAHAFKRSEQRLMEAQLRMVAGAVEYAYPATEAYPDGYGLLPR